MNSRISPKLGLAALASSSALLAGCQPSLTPSNDDASSQIDAFFDLSDGAIPPSSGAFNHRRLDDGSYETLVDATSRTEWRYLDLDTGLAVVRSDPERGRSWDLAFRRYVILSNGGVSGEGGVLVARVVGRDFAAIAEAPEDGWIADAPDGPDDRDEDNDSAFTNGLDDWYLYESSSHALTPRSDVVYVVRSTERRFYKLRIVGYYDAFGTPGFLRFQWAPVAAPASTRIVDAGPRPDAGPSPDAAHVDGGGPSIPPDALTIDASSRTSFTYFDIETMRVVTPSDPRTDTVWDLGFQRTIIQTNSGTSGPGLGGAVARERESFERVETTGTLGFLVDREHSSGMPGSTPISSNPALSAWFDYDFATHTVAPKDITFVVRTASGNYARLRVWHWDAGIVRLSIAPIEVRPETVEIRVDASTAGRWTYLDLHAARVVEVTDAATEAGWDLGWSRTAVRTNSGTSGPGFGGALDLAQPNFDAVPSVPEEGYAVDEILMESRPGAMPYSGNPILSRWFVYDHATHAVTIRPTTFAVRLADGSRGKLEVRSYESGVYVLGWSYAGPGRSGF